MQTSDIFPLQICHSIYKYSAKINIMW